MKVAVGDPSVPSEAGKEDILLDAPQLKAKTLAIETENLELASLVRIGKVRLAIENLDTELSLQTHLAELLHTINRLTSTINLSLGLFFAPAYNFNVAAAALCEYLDFARRWFDLSIKFAEAARRPGTPAFQSRPIARSSRRSAD
ncbi:MAG: hypothetical protein PHS17_20105 [Desulfobacterales bacterium]|nr:hypothetical protein [Desulfobacterales bacterium]